MSADRPDRPDRQRGLGRGLAALLGEDDDEKTGTGHAAPQQISIGDIYPSRFQPRHRFDDEELVALANSIREKGVLQPILIRPHPETPRAYEIIAGERRWRAAQRAGLHEIPAQIRDLSDRDALEVALVENIQRQDLSPLEEAEGYRRLMEEFDHTQDALARVVGKSRSHVANMLRLLSLPEPVKAMVDDGRLSAGHARALLNAEAPVELAEQVVDRQLNVRQTERLAQSGRKTPSTRKPPPGKSADLLALERELSERLGLRVTIEDRGGKGDIVIHYTSLDQLDDVLKRLGHRG